MNGFHGGLLQREILELRVGDINLNQRDIHVRQSKSDYDRHIPMNDSLHAVLKTLTPHPDSDLYFSYDDGKPLKRKGWVRNQLEKAVKNASILDFRFHDLPHCFASHFIMQGDDIAQ